MVLRLLAFNAEHWLADQLNAYLQRPRRVPRDHPPPAPPRRAHHLHPPHDHRHPRPTPPPPESPAPCALLLDELNTTPPHTARRPPPHHLPAHPVMIHFNYGSQPTSGKVRGLACRRRTAPASCRRAASSSCCARLPDRCARGRLAAKALIDNGAEFSRHPQEDAAAQQRDQPQHLQEKQIQQPQRPGDDHADRRRPPGIARRRRRARMLRNPADLDILGCVGEQSAPPSEHLG